MRFTTLFASGSIIAGSLALPALANNNDLVIQQLSDRNFASASQSGRRNESLIIQSDFGNGASNPVIGDDNDMLVIQETRRNFSEAAMGSGGNKNRVAVIQNGGNDNITIGPNPSGGAGGQGNSNSFASIQDGSNNVVNGGGARSGGTGIGFSWSVPDITTLGDINGGLIPAGLPASGGSGHSVFAGSQNVTLLGQVGSSNRFGVMTVGDRNSIVGFGAGSLAAVDMNSEAASRDAGGSFFDKGLSDALLDETDATRSGGAMAFGGGGLATQEGINNVAHLVQVGDENTIMFNQIGNDNTSQIYQVGNLNGPIAVQN